MNSPKLEHLASETGQKKKCCEQTFLGSVAGLQHDSPEEVGPTRRALGLVLLAGVHLHLIAWSAAMTPFVPRYRKILGFQVRYFVDVMGREISGR